MRQILFQVLCCTATSGDESHLLVLESVWILDVHLVSSLVHFVHIFLRVAAVDTSTSVAEFSCTQLAFEAAEDVCTLCSQRSEDDFTWNMHGSVDGSGGYANICAASRSEENCTEGPYSLRNTRNIA